MRFDNQCFQRIFFFQRTIKSAILKPHINQIDLTAAPSNVASLENAIDPKNLPDRLIYTLDRNLNATTLGSPSTSIPTTSTCEFATDENILTFDIKSSWPV